MPPGVSEIFSCFLSFKFPFQFHFDWNFIFYWQRQHGGSHDYLHVKTGIKP
jgi:hypothetical protein